MFWWAGITKPGGLYGIWYKVLPAGSLNIWPHIVRGNIQKWEEEEEHEEEIWEGGGGHKGCGGGEEKTRLKNIRVEVVGGSKV